MAVGFAALGLVRFPDSSRWLSLQQALRWAALLLVVWLVNGLPFDLFAAAGLMGHRTADGAIEMAVVYWPGLATTDSRPAHSCCQRAIVPTLGHRCLAEVGFPRECAADRR